jgi:hypothetical protein
MTEMTFKVFPRPLALRTLRLEAKDFAAKARIFMEAANTRWELDALDAALDEPAVYARIGGPPEALDALTTEIFARFPGVALTAGEANYLWQAVVGFRWAYSGGTLVKLALTPKQIPEPHGLRLKRERARGLARGETSATFHFHRARRSHRQHGQASPCAGKVRSGWARATTAP